MVIYCSVTGYGQTGHLRDRVGHDVNYLGQSGVLSLIGCKKDKPCIPGVQFADMIGGLNAAVGIMLALFARERLGRGQYIDISMTDCMIAMLPLAAGLYWTTGTKPRAGESLLSHRYACYNVYRTADSRFVTLGALEPRFWAKVCEYFDVPQYIPLQFDEAKRQEIIKFFEDTFVKKTQKEWVEALGAEDTCLGEILELDEALTSEYAKDRAMIADVGPDHGKGSAPVLGIPVKMSHTPGSVRSPAPRFGENNLGILEELGLSKQEIAELKAGGVI